jgi:hypothetical protein
MIDTDVLNDYVSRDLLAAMGITGRHFTLEPAGAGAAPTRRVLVRIEGMPPLLLRAFGRRRQGVKNAEALRHLDGLGIAAPRLVAHDVAARPGRLLRGEAGHSFVTVETWIEGTPHADLTDPADAASATLDLARLLARWHAITRLRWGRPAAGRVWPYAPWTLAGVRRMTSGLSAAGWLDSAQARDLLARFTAWKSALASIDTFHLVHGRLSRRNVIVIPDGGVVPVDLHHLSYQPFPEEIANVLSQFCRHDETLGARFLETYFEHAGPGARATWDRLRGVFEPLGCLKKLSRRGRRAGITRDDAAMAAWRARVTEISPPRS